MADPANQPAPEQLQPPPGGRLLTPDEAIELIVTGDHPGSITGGVDLDLALIDLLRAGLVAACQFADGRLAFTPVNLDFHPATTPLD